MFPSLREQKKENKWKKVDYLQAFFFFLPISFFRDKKHEICQVLKRLLVCLKLKLEVIL